MNDMIVKSVDLMGDTVMAAQDKDGNIWAGVSYFCNALGMNKKQKDWQTEKVQSDKILSRGAGKFGAGVFDQNNDTIALRLDFVPLWLTKISITKQMEKSHPELADKLLEYQLKAKDILAAAFLQQPQLPTEPMEMLKIHYAALEQVDQKVSDVDKKVNTLEQRFNKFEDDLPVTGADIDHIQSAVRKKGIQSLGGKQSNAYKDISTRTFVYADIQCELRRQFGVKRYREIKHKDAPDAIRIIVNYELPIALKNRVDMVNAQESLDLEGKCV